MRLLAAILTLSGMLYGAHRSHRFLVGGRFWLKFALVVTAVCTGPMAYGQSPAAWWAATDGSQRARAAIVYKVGVEHGDKGHTAVAIYSMESSLGADTDHNEPSYGACGLSEVALLDLGYGSAVFDSLRQGSLGLERETIIALEYFALVEGRLRNLGFSPREAWFWSYPRYNAGKNWQNFKRRGEVFNARVKFLKEQFR